MAASRNEISLFVRSLVKHFQHSKTEISYLRATTCYPSCHIFFPFFFGQNFEPWKSIVNLSSLQEWKKQNR